jgi:hypothetical protein
LPVDTNVPGTDMIRSPSGTETRTLLVGALLAALVVTSGCQGLLGGSEGMSPKEREIKANTLDATSEMTSYRMTMDVEAAGDGRDVSMQAESAINRTSERLRMNLSIDVTGRDVEMRQYVVGSTLYQRLGDAWQQRSMADSAPWNQSRLAAQREVLSDVPFELTGNTTIDGTEVYVIEMDVQQRHFESILSQQQQFQGMARNMDVSDLHHTMYVGHDTYEIRRATLEGTMSRDGTSVDVTVDIRLRDYGDRISITLPPAARNASAGTTPASSQSAA